MNNGRSTDTATLPSRLKLGGWWHATDASVNEDKCIEYLTKRLEDVEAETPTVTVLPAFAPASESATRICPGCKVRLEFSEKSVKPELTTQYKLGATPVNVFSSLRGLKANQNAATPQELLFSLYNAGEKEIWEGTVGTLTLAPGVHPFNLNTALVDGSGLPFALISPGTGLARYNYVAAPAPEDAPTAEIEYADGAELPVALDGVGATPRFNQSERTLSIEIETGFPAFDEPTGTLTRPGGLGAVTLAFTNRAVSVNQTVLSANGQYTVTVDSYTNNAGQNMTAVSRSFIIDTTAPTITIESPPSNSTVTNATVEYDLDEDLSEGKISWTWTSGTPDGGSPHEKYLAGAELQTGDHTDSSITGLVDGGIYTLTVSGKDLAGNTAQVNHTNITYNEPITQDPPYVKEISSLTPDGIYNAGDHINVQVTFDRAVTVTYPPGSAPTLALNSGGTAAYTGGSGMVTLTFDYLVADGENTPDLDAAAVSALNANGSTIEAADDAQPANLAVPVKPTEGALGTNKNIIIDTVVPTINILSPSSNSFILNSDVTYQFGETLKTATISWTRTDATETPHTKNLSGTELQTGNRDALNTASLTWGGVYTLTVSGEDLAGNYAEDVHTNITIGYEHEAPYVEEIDSDTPDGSYKKDAVINIQVTFNRAVTVTCPPGSTPTLALNSGVSAVATYTASLNNTTLSFEYRVAAGENTPDLDSASVSALNANGATIQGLDDGQPANLAVPVKPTDKSLGMNKNIIIDTTVPTITIESPPSNSFVQNSESRYDFGETLSEGKISWTRTDAPESAHENILAGAELQTGNHTDTSITGLVWGGVYTLTVSGKDLAGNYAEDVHTNITIGYEHEAPKVTNITSNTANGSYKKDAVINIQLTFNRAVTVTYPPGSAPTLALNSGGSATYINGTGNAILNFRYTVAAGQNTSDLDSASVSALNANGATIQGADDGQPANLAVPVKPTLGALGVNKAIIIDTKAPTLNAISGVIRESLFPWPFRGKILEVTMKFNEVVYVDTSGTTVELQVTDAPRASYKSGDGTNTLVFTHRFSGSTLPYTRTGVTGKEILCVKGYIRDAAGNDAIMILPPPPVCKLAICSKPVDCGLKIFCGKPVTCGYKIFDEPDLCLFKIDFCNPKIYPGCLHGIGPDGGDFCPTINPGPFDKFEHRIREIIEHNDYRGLAKLRSSKEFKMITDALGPAQTKNLVELLDAMAKELKR